MWLLYPREMKVLKVELEDHQMEVLDKAVALYGGNVGRRSNRTDLVTHWISMGCPLMGLRNELKEQAFPAAPHPLIHAMSPDDLAGMWEKEKQLIDHIEKTKPSKTLKDNHLGDAASFAHKSIADMIKESVARRRHNIEQSEKLLGQDLWETYLNSRGFVPLKDVPPMPGPPSADGDSQESEIPLLLPRLKLELLRWLKETYGLSAVHPEGTTLCPKCADNIPEDHL